MNTFLRQIGFAILVLILTVVIFLLVSRNNELKQNVIENSLGVLGEQLFAMVPDGEQKQSVKDQYERFMERVSNSELEPAQVEHVAATILNVSNRDTLISPEAAKAIFAVNVVKPTVPATPPPLSDTMRIMIPHASKGSPFPPPPPVSPEDWKNLGQRIRRMCKLNENLQREFAKHAELQRQLPRQMQFLAEDGLRLAMDAQLQHRLKRGEFQNLRRELDQLEREKIVVWRENIVGTMDSLHLEMAKLKEIEKLQQLKHLIQLQELDALPGPDALKALGALKALESLEALEVLDSLQGPPLPDSIRSIVRKALEEAGIAPPAKVKK